MNQSTITVKEAWEKLGVSAKESRRKKHPLRDFIIYQSLPYANWYETNSVGDHLDALQEHLNLFWDRIPEHIKAFGWDAHMLGDAVYLTLQEHYGMPRTINVKESGSPMTIGFVLMVDEMLRQTFSPIIDEVMSEDDFKDVLSRFVKSEDFISRFEAHVNEKLKDMGYYDTITD